MEQELPPKTIQTEDQQHTHIGVVIFLGISAFFAVGLGGVLLGKYLYAPKTAPATLVVTPTQTPIATPTSDLTVGFLEYVNNKAGYIFKYPSDWKLKQNLNGSITLRSSDFEQNEKNPLEEEAKSGANLLINGPIPDALPEIKEGQILKGTDTTTDKVASNIQKLTIDGKNAITWDYQAAGNPHFIGTQVVILKEGKVYYLNMTFSDKSFKSRFDQILSTFRFLDGSIPTVAITSQGKRLTYSLPAGWVTVSDTTGKLEVGYDPARYDASARDQRIDLSGRWTGTGSDVRRLGWNKHVYLKSPSGGSRHQELYKILGVDRNSASWKSPTYYAEREYSYSGWNCLVINGVDISQYPVAWGYCPISANQALVLAFDGYNWSEIEQQLAAVKVLK